LYLIKKFNTDILISTHVVWMSIQYIISSRDKRARKDSISRGSYIV
jgi:hypothetical protein